MHAPDANAEPPPRANFGHRLNSAVVPLATRGTTKSFWGSVRRTGMRRTWGFGGARAFLVWLGWGSALIAAMSLAYFDFETLPPFVIEKLPLRFESLWLGALRIHVA